MRTAEQYGLDSLRNDIINLRGRVQSAGGWTLPINEYPMLRWRLSLYREWLVRNNAIPDCHEVHSDIGLVYKCATVCAGLSNCKLKTLDLTSKMANVTASIW